MKCEAATQAQPSQPCNMREFGIKHNCRKCRMSRCLDIGMNPKKVLLDYDRFSRNMSSATGKTL